VQARVLTRIVTIGNSRGIRIPRVLLDSANLGEEVELELRQGELIIRSARRARSAWDDKFRAMASQGDDALLDGDQLAASAWDEEEWEW
jgi:antitoxin MazE